MSLDKTKFRSGRYIYGVFLGRFSVYVLSEKRWDQRNNSRELEWGRSLACFRKRGVPTDFHVSLDTLQWLASPTIAESIEKMINMRAESKSALKQFSFHGFCNYFFFFMFQPVYLQEQCTFLPDSAKIFRKF